MDVVWIEYVPWIYASVQLTITIIVSVMGVKYVRNELRLQKSTVKQQTELQIMVKNKTNQNEEDVKIEDGEKTEEPRHNQPDQIKVFLLTNDVLYLIHTNFLKNHVICK